MPRRRRACARPAQVGSAEGEPEVSPGRAGPRAAAGRAVADSRLPTMAARFHTAGSTVEPVSGRRPVKAEAMSGRGRRGTEAAAPRRADRVAEGDGAVWRDAEARRDGEARR